jgi:hypothetical protein
MNSLLRNWRESDWSIRAVYAVLLAETLIAVYLIWSMI